MYVAPASAMRAESARMSAVCALPPAPVFGTPGITGGTPVTADVTMIVPDVAGRRPFGPTPVTAAAVIEAPVVASTAAIPEGVIAIVNVPPTGVVELTSQVSPNISAEPAGIVNGVVRLKTTVPPTGLMLPESEPNRFDVFRSWQSESCETEAPLPAVIESGIDEMRTEVAAPVPREMLLSVTSWDPTGTDGAISRFATNGPRAFTFGVTEFRVNVAPAGTPAATLQRSVRTSGFALMPRGVFNVNTLEPLPITFTTLTPVVTDAPALL